MTKATVVIERFGETAAIAVVEVNPFTNFAVDIAAEIFSRLYWDENLTDRRETVTVSVDGIVQGEFHSEFGYVYDSFNTVVYVLD